MVQLAHAVESLDMGLFSRTLLFVYRVLCINQNSMII